MSDENILINIEEDNSNTIGDSNELDTILKEIENSTLHRDAYLNYIPDDTDFVVKEMDYELNYNVKQLLLICDYYGIAKQMKSNKFKKQDIINFLVHFETNPENIILVQKRKQLWYLMEELKNDKFMKKYILW